MGMESPPGPAPQVTGLGGVFCMVRNPEASRAWYREALGIDGPFGPQRAWAGEPSATFIR
jgi:hypothetical protein